MVKSFSVVKVVTKNFFSDWWQGVRNLIGMNLRGYEEMVQEGIMQCEEELKVQGIKPVWYRINLEQLTNGAVLVCMYGEKKG